MHRKKESYLVMFAFFCLKLKLTYTKTATFGMF